MNVNELKTEEIYGGGKNGATLRRVIEIKDGMVTSRRVTKTGPFHYIEEGGEQTVKRLWFAIWAKRIESPAHYERTVGREFRRPAFN